MFSWGCRPTTVPERFRNILRIATLRVVSATYAPEWFWYGFGDCYAPDLFQAIGGVIAQFEGLCAEIGLPKNRAKVADSHNNPDLNR